ncbi:MAG: hypothetical protein HKP14_06095 [Bacteroidia bacterium]|nr:hypothetical protein [Bacteroidia bacterium]
MLPTFMDAYYLRGKYFYTYKMFDKAIEDLNIYLLSNEKDAGAFVIRGESYAEKEEYSLAARDYSSAIAIEGDNPDYYFDRGFFYIQLEEFKNAQVDFKKAIFFRHKDIKLSYFNLGIAEYRLGNKEEACKDWKKSEELGMDYINKYCN